MTAILLSQTNFLNYGYLLKRIKINTSKPSFLMAQPTGQSGGKDPLGITSFRPSTFAEPPILWEFWFNRFQWGMVAKYSINPKNFYYASTLTAAQVTDLPVEVDGKNRQASEQTLISNLFLCQGRKDRMSYIRGNHTWIYLQQ